MKLVSMLVRLLVVVGALNWGLWGFFQFDLVAFIFGGNATMMARLVYALVGIAGVMSVKSVFSCSCSCHTKGGGGCCK
jgi:uncharacterized protein